MGESSGLPCGIIACSLADFPDLHQRQMSYPGFFARELQMSKMCVHSRELRVTPKKIVGNRKEVRHVLYSQDFSRQKGS